ncbi:MucR family transcriptional regulator [Geomonas edaphica]|uniref:MucR family transcriptional regulator n=1 Tax=Geomonas edaphica TaxID=2570226 RepID=UPI0010A8F36C|nr:MucR family transcriptional regulator [Geomonas edaphica]
MASSLLELTASIVSSHASVTEMSGDDLLLELQKVHGALQKLEVETGEGMEVGGERGPTLTLKKAFQPDQISCMLCGKTGMKTLARHLAQVHGVKPGEYRKQFGIPSNQALTAKNFSEARRRMAQEKGLADNLAKARAVRAAKLAAKGGAEKKPVKQPRGSKQKQQMSA